MAINSMTKRIKRNMDMLDHWSPISVTENLSGRSAESAESPPARTTAYVAYVNELQALEAENDMYRSQLQEANACKEAWEEKNEKIRRETNRILVYELLESSDRFPEVPRICSSGATTAPESQATRTRNQIRAPPTRA